MRKSRMLALFLAMTAAGPAIAQPSDNARGGVATETQARIAQGDDHGLTWDLLGLLGLLGVLGLRKKHAEDGYHPAPIE